MRFLSTLLVLLAFLGCSTDDDNSRITDASVTPSDAGPGTSDAPTDGSTSRACTGALYDPCADNSQCQSGNCRELGGGGGGGTVLKICTQACDGATACPTQGGQPVNCNGMNVCRAQVANACTR